MAQFDCEKLETGDVQARKAYLQTVLDQVEVGDTKSRVLADKAALAAAARGYSEGSTKVRGFERKMARPKRFELLTF